MPLQYDAANVMKNAIAAMKTHLGVDQVGLVMRWNKRSDLIWTIYSETMDIPDALNIPPQQRTVIDRRNGDAREDLEVFSPATSVVSQIGCHAEEIMIANWTYFETDTVAKILEAALQNRAADSDAPLATEKFKLTEVDLVLSKSPCSGPGGSQPLVCGVHIYGTSCTMKLYRFCSLPQFSAVQWRIFYCALPPEKMQTRMVEKAPAPGLSKKDLKTFTAQQTQRMQTLSANVAPRLGANFASPSQFQARSQVGSLLGQALNGIGKLNQLRNVTVEPLNAS